MLSRDHIHEIQDSAWPLQQTEKQFVADIIISISPNYENQYGKGLYNIQREQKDCLMEICLSYWWLQCLQNLVSNGAHKSVYPRQLKGMIQKSLYNNEGEDCHFGRCKIDVLFYALQNTNMKQIKYRALMNILWLAKGYTSPNLLCPKLSMWN